ncbi:MAG: valine--tRNA ligase [Planctomycetes bacterium]|nr:valine--tRNA ligase [Planctomycetota bacterium]
MSSLPQKYVPGEHEPRIREKWAAERAFHADPAKVLSGEKRPYAIFIPPPNVTDRLHLGHALNNTLQDVQARAHRMKGFETLWMPGTDHAGIATQTVVEKRVQKETGRKRTDFPREEFVAKIQAFKDEYEAIITEQLKAMGCSCDWERQRFTMDPVCARAVREAFFRLFRDGLIYRGKRLVNWDPVTQTALADDEVEMEEVDGNFYYLRYPLCHGKNGAGLKGVIPVTWDELKRRGYPSELGADSHPDSEQAWVTVATTRPETYLGDTAVAVNPKDPRAKALRGLHCELPLVGRVIPIIEDEYVVLPAALQEDPEAAKRDPKAAFATGFLKVTPAHDTNDYNLWQKHKVEFAGQPNAGLINIFGTDAAVSDKHGWTDVGDAHLFVGLAREAARKKVVEEFKARGLLERVKPYRHSVGHSYRSHAAIEPYLSDQWYVKVTDDRLAGAANRALVGEQRAADQKASRHQGIKSSSDGGLTFHPDRYAKTYESWHDNIRDWCISRQLWWGHRIPVWTTSSDAKETRLFLDRLGLDMPEDGQLDFEQCDDRGEPAIVTRVVFAPDGGSHSFCCVAPDHPEAEQEVEARGFVRDPDVLDTWFSSALWPLSTLGWPVPPAEMKGLLEAFNPSNVLCTAREIITLWVSRMVMFNRYLHGDGGGAGPLPFKDVFIHSVIQDGEGRKMSKSLGNGVNPLDIIQSHGSDAMRFTLCKMTTNTQDVRLPVVFDKEKGCNTSPKFDEGRNFVTKVFNAAKFVMMNLADAGEQAGGTGHGSESRGTMTTADRWILSRLARVTRRVDAAVAAYDYSDYAEAMYQFLWWDFCDWYLEAIKPSVKTNATQRAVVRNVLEAALRLLHPICPFVTEVLHEALGAMPAAATPGLGLGSPASTMCRTPWVTVEDSLIDEGVEREVEWLRALTEAIRQVRAAQGVEPRRRITLHTDAAAMAKIRAGAGLVETLAGLAGVETGDAVSGGGAGSGGQRTPFVFDGREHALSNLKDALDSSVERKMLAEQVDRLDKEIAVLEGRLANPGYAERAPAKLVQQTKDQLGQKCAERDAARRRLTEIG